MFIIFGGYIALKRDHVRTLNTPRKDIVEAVRYTGGGSLNHHPYDVFYFGNSEEAT